MAACVRGLATFCGDDCGCEAGGLVGVGCLAAGSWPGIVGRGTGVTLGGVFSGFEGGNVGVLMPVSSNEGASLAALSILQCTQQQSRYACDDERSHIMCAANSCGLLKSLALTGYPDTQRCLDFSYSQ